MYTKKIMQRGMKPKNTGEIKNADGVGEVGNTKCLLPNEKIHKNSELIGISNLNKDYNVLTHLGDYDSINRVYSKNYTGKIIKLKNKLGKINLTPDHLIYAIHVPQKNKFLRNKGKKQLIPTWYHADQLKKGDLVLYPILTKEEDINFIDINYTKSKWDFKSKKIPKKVILDGDLLRLFGYFITEGHVSDKPCNTYISFAFNINEENLVDDVKNISKKLFDLDVIIRKVLKRKTMIVLIYNAHLARWFKSLFGTGAEHKKIPDFIMNLPPEKQKFLLFGLWKGDGYINLNRTGPRAGYATISYQLAHQIKTLLLRQKIVPSLYEDKEKKINGVNHKKAYRIHIGQRDSLINFCKLFNLEYNPKSYASIDSWFDNIYLYTPITNKEIFEYSGKVYNLEINKIHSFVSEAFSLHNCGDIMRVYIKIKNNKIIKIKFKTYGCIAAIASSDALCDLAKGKTIQEAKKITSKDIINYLGGKIPPIKVHCSVLGQNALKKAIEDYEKKLNR